MATFPPYLNGFYGRLDLMNDSLVQADIFYFFSNFSTVLALVDAAAVH